VAGAGWGGTSEHLSACWWPRSGASLRSAGCSSSPSPAADALTPWPNSSATPARKAPRLAEADVRGRKPDFTIDRTDLDAPSFLLLGDTGEGDISQYAPMSVIESVAPNTDFMIICSDIIYPAGGIVEYAYKPSLALPQLSPARLRAARQPRLV
jgi:hypothetical protein